MSPLPCNQSRALPGDEASRRYQEALEREQPEIVALVNAAGYGKFTPFAEMDMASQLGIVELNDRALTAMCHMSLPYMHPGSKIINLQRGLPWAPPPPGSRCPI